MKLRLIVVLATLLGWQEAQAQTTITPAVPSSTPFLAVVKTEVQPDNTLAPLRAKRLPFTKLLFTAHGAKRIDVDGLVTERQGLSVDSVLDSVVALDEQGMEMGTEKWLDSNHQAVLNAKFSLEPGESRTVTLAGNRPSWGNAGHAGMQVSLALVEVKTSVTYGGAFPLVGATHTINEGLNIGTVIAMRSLLDPGTSSVQYVGTSQFMFSAVRLVAGSVEGGILRGIRWHQAGTAISSDVEVETYVNGTRYNTTVSANGRYYTTIFSSPIQWGSGRSIDVVVGGSLLNGAGRTVNFDIESRSDIYITGSTYGFNILPEYGVGIGVPDSATVQMLDNPYYDGAKITILPGSIEIRPSDSPSQNISGNTTNQPLGGSFVADVWGEPVIVRRVGFNVSLKSAGGASDVDDLFGITLVDETGRIVSGPVDGIAADSAFTTGARDGSVIFTDVTFSVGRHWYTPKGRANTDLIGTTVQFSSTPSTDFGPARGLTTDAYITIGPASEIMLSPVTVIEPPPPLTARITSIVFTGDGVEITAQATPNQLFGLDWSDDLVHWSPGNAIVGASPSGRWFYGTEIINPPPRQFFRVSSR